MRRTAIAVAAGCIAAAAWASPAPLGEVVRLSPEIGSHATPEIVRTPGGGVVATWYASGGSYTDYDVLAQVFGPNGAPASPVIEVNQLRAGVQIVSAVAADGDGNFVVVWRSSTSAPAYADRAIYGRRFAASGAPLGDEFKVTTTSSDDIYEPSVAMAADGRFVVVWKQYTHVRARLYGSDGAPQGNDFALRPSNGDAWPDVAMNDDGSFVVAYAVPGSTLADGQDVLVSGHAADGQALFGPVHANPQPDAAHASVPAIARQADGSFQVAWSRSATGESSRHAYLRRFDPAGIPLGEPVQVSDQQISVFVALGVDAQGAATVAWTGTDGRTLYARSLDRSGNPEGGSFIVEAGDGIAGFASRGIAYDDNGDFAIAWYRYQGESAAIFGRFYDAIASDDPPPPPVEDPPPPVEDPPPPPPPVEDPPPPDDGDQGCDHDEESDEDDDNGCGNDDRDESGADEDDGYGNDGKAATTAGGLGHMTLLLLAVATLLRRRRSTGAGRTSGSPARC